uniref:Tripartite motif-containing protein 2-like n=1 Tax=Crassostrea virginica TaxID=6565 RepID=A0A8B8C8E3_CRAVI|nr:tripartite motif-containing protein 2-like [Crassostrea virginica]
MASSTSWAQDVITCDLCDKPTQQFCNSCQVNLCETCVKKHRDEFKSLMHEIVPLLERKIQLVFPECREHSGQRCEVNCKKCYEPVCVKCIGLGPHKGHDVEELTETYEKKIRKIKSDTEEINAKIIPKYQKEDDKIGNTISENISKIDDLGKESKKLRQLWHQEVDNVFDKIDSLGQSLGEENLNALQGYHNKIRKLISEMNETVKEAEAWIYGENETITRIDIQGTVREIVTTTFHYGPNDISVTRERELIYSDGNGRSVNIVRDGKSGIRITPPRGWGLGKLCCTRSGNILVHMCTRNGPLTKNKIIRYQEKNIKQEISNDGQGNPIFKDGIYCSLLMSENNNGDVCVSDANANTVVVVDKTGRVRFRYDGTPARREKSFNPRGIVTDALNQIIVADYNNNCLHILDQNGQFLRCVDDCGLGSPHGLSADSEGRLWVGSLNSGEIKVIQYLRNK